MKNNGYTRSPHAFLISQLSLIGFSALGLIDIAALFNRLYFFGTVFSLIIIFILNIIFHHLDRVISEAFSIPMILFFVHSGMSFLTKQYNDYFIYCVGISCICALFFNRKALLKYLVITNLLIILQLILRAEIPAIFYRIFFNMDMRTILLNLIITFFGTIFIYLITTFAENNKNDAIMAQNSFVSLLISTPDPIVLLDSLNRVTYISNSFMEIVHLDKAFYAKGRSIFDLLKDQSLKDLFYEILSKSGPRQITREIILNHKQYFFEVVVFELEKEIEGRMVNLIDITPVMNAKFEAEAASRSKSAFLATMSHEIRTPLNAIIGLSDIELQKTLSTYTRINLEKIHSSGTTLLGIINDILDISKIEAGSFELVLVDYDTPSMVNDTVQLNMVRIGSKNIVFRLKINDSIPTKLYGDELRVKQILSNLLSNAIKYTDEGSVVLSIDWEKRGPDALIIFKITDTGHGIKDEDLPGLFSEYRQLNAKANRHIEGTGLGLSITKNLVHLMNGTINVESTHGKGSCFTVKIMQRIADGTPIGNKTAHILELFRYKANNRSRELKFVRNYMPYGKVLVVDDVETNLDVAKGLMRPYGLSIDTATSGFEAISKIRANGEKDKTAHYDLVLMDHMMPGMDGIEAVKIIRNEINNDLARSVPIIALTANALTGNEEMFLTNGFNAFISKPIDVLHLDAALNTWIRKKQSIETLKQAEKNSSSFDNFNEETSNLLDGVVLDGVDLKKGRERYMTESSYIEILRSWHLHTPALLEKMKTVTIENATEYAVAVHGLKGSSFGIYADAVGKKAEELEYYAKAGELSRVQAENPGFIETVEALLQNIGDLLKNTAIKKSKKETAVMPDPDLLAKLLDAVKSYKTAKIEEIIGKLEEFDYETGGEMIEWIRSQWDNLEYSAICSRLESSALLSGNGFKQE
ncbi:MAG: ATP-binding protein [Treponema sp.]|nr:ATP-binding protein [Treponema sp.]